MGDLLNMIPGVKKLTKGIDMSAAETELKRSEAIIDSMTNEERNNLILNGSRRSRIAAGSGTSVADVNRFLKQFQQTKKMMKQMASFAGRGMPPGLGDCDTLRRGVDERHGCRSVSPATAPRKTRSTASSSLTVGTPRRKSPRADRHL